jgi:ribosomal protein S21
MAVSNTFVEVIGGNIAGAIKKWKKGVESYKIKERLQEIKTFTKPSVKKRKQKLEAIYKQSKRNK